MHTLKVTSTEFQAKFGQLADKALTEPVTITKNGHRLVLISAEEYARMRRRERRVYRAGELPQYLVDAIRQAEPPPEAAAFDSEVPEGWTGQ